MVSGLEMLINLYRPFDHTFFEMWNKVGPSAERAYADFVSELHQQILSAVPAGYLDSLPVQAVNIQITQQWLRIIIWRLCYKESWLSVDATDISLGYNFPINVATEVLEIAQRYPLQFLEVHGASLVRIYVPSGSFHISERCIVSWRDTVLDLSSLVVGSCATTMIILC